MAKYLLFGIAIINTILMDYLISGIQLPDIYWHPDEPLFNKTHCQRGSREIYVREYDVMNIVCANRDLNNAVKEVAGVVSPKGYTYNVLVTQDSELFENRQIQDTSSSSSSSSSSRSKRKAKLFYICREQKIVSKHGVHLSVVEKFSIRFTPIQVSLGQFVFTGGNTYYFYTTSNGSEAGLANNQGSISTRHMYLKVRVCGPNEVCDDRRFRVNRCLQPMVARPQVSDGLQRESGINETMLPIFLSLALGLGVLIGAVTPCLWTRMKKRQSMETVVVLEQSRDSETLRVCNEDESLTVTRILKFDMD